MSDIGTDIITAMESGSIGPNEQVVTFCKLVCRSCEAESPWLRADDGAACSGWDGEHHDSTGHSTFYLWSVTRQTAEVFTLAPGQGRHERQ